MVGKGALINDGLAWAILARKMLTVDTSQGFLIDGYPRTLEEAEIMDLMGFPYDLMISLRQKEEVLEELVLKRRSCSQCGASFNLAQIEVEGYKFPTKFPKKKGICDDCGGKLVTRNDDTKRVFKKRLFEFRVKTEPLEGFFEEKNKLFTYDILKGIDDFPDFLGKLKQKLN